jgi:hydrogenase maturation protease
MNGIIIGIGNRYRGDDGIGPLILDRIDLSINRNFDIVESDGEPTGLISLFRERDWCIFIDAIIPNIHLQFSPGMVVSMDLLMEGNNFGTELSSTHTGGLFDAIGLASVLGCLPKKVFLVGVVGSTFGSCAHLSQSVQSAIEQALDEVEQLVRSLVNEKKQGGIMHESAMIDELVTTALAWSAASPARRIRSITVEVGALSPCDPEHLREHFVEACKGTWAEGASLIVIPKDDITDQHAQDVTMVNLTVEEPSSCIPAAANVAYHG